MQELVSHPDLHFHHIGVATNSIETDVQLLNYLGYTIEGSRFTDAEQGVNGCFMTGGGPRIELICDMPGHTTVSGILNKGIKFYHLAYSVSNLSLVVGLISSMRGLVVRKPLPSTAFDGRSVMFVAFRNNMLVEFIGHDDITVRQEVS
jgi:methylmalonyl-CoA/ethylmalonyl-CoA epimerase